jgi:hypothetical protein
MVDTGGLESLPGRAVYKLNPVMTHSLKAPGFNHLLENVFLFQLFALKRFCFNFCCHKFSTCAATPRQPSGRAQRGHRGAVHVDSP